MKLTFNETGDWAALNAADLRTRHPGNTPIIGTIEGQDGLCVVDEIFPDATDGSLHIEMSLQWGESMDVAEAA